MSTILAFSAEQVCQLTELSKRQLRYWDETGFFSPSAIPDAPRRSYGRIYSFRDVVGLRVLAQLRDHVSLQELRKLGAWLHQQYETPWAGLRFYVGGRKIFFDDPESGARLAGRSPEQAVFPVEMAKVEDDVRGRIRRLQARAPDEVGQITQHRYVVHNEPVLKGTRIPTQAIWNFYKAGYGVAQIIREYPALTPEDIFAAIDFERQRRQEKAG